MFLFKNFNKFNLEPRKCHCPNGHPSICGEEHMLLVNGVQNSQFLHKKKERKKEPKF